MTTVFNRLGPYEITREIGRGGMAVVFLALDSRTGRQVALKTVPQGNDREAREVLEAERYGAELQKQFSQVNDHVPAVFEHGTDESGYFYVAMEYLDGENLSEVISRGPLSVERAVKVAIELCRFLEDAHRFEAVIDGREFRSLLHLDLKPRNVRITSAEQVKVLDFGIAKALSLSRKVTRNDFGSVAYVSPERLETGEVDAFADFWALGVLLYEMTAGSPPFQAPDTRRLERLILSRRPPAPLTGRCPAGLQAVIARLLAPAPTQRYQSARDIREDLERFTSGERTRAEEEGWPERGADEEPTRRTQVPSILDEEKTHRTHPPADGATSTSGAGSTTPAAAQGSPSAAEPRADRGKKNVRRIVRAALIIIVLGLVANEIQVGNAAGRLAGTLPTRELDQLADAWSSRDRLMERSHLGFGTFGLDRLLVERTSVLANRVISNYQMPSPTVREAQWRMAREALARAVALSPRDKELRASLRYCEGHLHRINGEARKGKEPASDAQRELAEAVAAFREAAELRPNWPEPFLGLARTFIYGLEDVDRGADALKQAEKNGYAPTERDMAQLADGYRARGNALVRNARGLSGMPQERDYLVRAAEAYRQALTLYPKAGTFANVPSNIRLTQRALDQVQHRLEELSPATSESATGDGTVASPAVSQSLVSRVSAGQGAVPWA
ncbi:MAG: protein kinase domain-containing protein [Acidobacteriota bacterium]